MAFDKEAWVNLQIQDNDRALTFCNSLSPIRLQMLVALLRTLRLHIHDAPDRAIWKIGSSATFIVRSQYYLLKPP